MKNSAETKRMRRVMAMGSLLWLLTLALPAMAQDGAAAKIPCDDKKFPC